MTRFGATPVDAAELLDAAGNIVGVQIVHPDGEPCWGVPYGEQCRCGVINTDPAAPPIVVPVADLDERACIAAAAKRFTVHLDDGRHATLIRFGGVRRFRWQYSIRVQWPNGRRATLPERALAAVVYPAGPNFSPTLRRRLP